MINSLSQSYQDILQKIDNANHPAERPQAARLLAVSKMQSASAVRDLATLGQRTFGENYVQEAIAKQRELQDLPLEWHLIGPLQSNKCAEAAAHFDWIQSLSRLKLVEPLNRYRPEQRDALSVLIQVNIDGEASKSGCSPADIDSIADAIFNAPRLKLRGLMAIPEPSPDLEKRRGSFRELNVLFEQLKARYPECDTLSMGMSDDFELAIEQGSTLVRIGSALFGARKAERPASTTDHNGFQLKRIFPMPSHSNINITFIGGGNMARSLIGGLIQKGVPAEKIKVSEPVAVLAEALAKDFSVATFSDNADACATANIWLFAVKPQVMKSVCQQLSPLAQANKPLIVSIAAGITSQQLDAWLGGNMPVVRIMPNTPALLGAGASGLFANAHVSAAQKQHAQDLMQATGITVWIENETLMDAVTAVSGSGPAYVFLLAEAMQAAGVAQGLSAEASRALTNQTLLGAARMLSETAEPAEVLRQRVTSPGGTTAAAIESFEAQNFRGIVNNAIEAATQRGRALSAAND